MPNISFTAVKPTQFRDSAFNSEYRRAVNTFTKRVRRDFERTTRTWNHPVKFQQSTSVTGSAVDVEVFTFDLIYMWVDEGTSVRYATMTDDFVSKTSPGSLNSGPGRGGLAYVNKALPRPGIDARDFTGQITRSREPDFRELMQEAMERAAERSGHGL